VSDMNEELLTQLQEVAKLEKKLKKHKRFLKATIEELYYECLLLMRQLDRPVFWSNKKPVNCWVNLHKVCCSDSDGENVEYYFMTRSSRQVMEHSEITITPYNLDNLQFFSGLKSQLEATITSKTLVIQL
jgi:hypothetical protein